MSKYVLVVAMVCLAIFCMTADRVGAQQQSQWEPLFNGEDLSGWEGVGGHTDDWHVEDGEIVLTGRSEGGAGWLATEKQYSNFELKLEFLLYEGGNSGVFVRAPKSGNPAGEGIEIQLLDDYADKHANLNNYQYCGSVYGVAGPSERVTKQPGEWQSMHIHMNNGHVWIAINGERVVETNLDDHLDKAEQWQGIVRRVGHIGLQSYGERLRFRNIEVRELE